jgi:hypothetical protein
MITGRPGRILFNERSTMSIAVDLEHLRDG